MSGIRYFRPKSLTWWVGALSTGIGIASAAGLGVTPDTPTTGVGGVLRTVKDVLTALYGADASPAGLIVLGLGLIGLRDAQHRDNEKLLTLTAEQVVYERRDEVMDSLFEDGFADDFDDTTGEFDQ